MHVWRGHRPVLLLVLSAASLVSVANAQPDDVSRRRLRMALSSTVDSIRSHAPVLLDVNLSWSSPRLLEGRLRLDFYVDTTHMGTWISRDLVLSNDVDLTLPLMLPPVIIPKQDLKYTVRAEFITDDETIPLDEHDVAVPFDGKRILVAGIVHPFELARENGSFPSPEGRPFAFQDSLRLENNRLLGVRSHDLSSRIVDVLPEELPDSSLEYLMFDLLLVTELGFERLHPEQLEALTEWCEGGGRVCLVTEKVETTAQEDCVRRLLGETALSPAVSIDDEGSLRLLAPHQENLRWGAPGVGRSVVSVDPVDVRSGEWVEAVYWLWGIRSHLPRGAPDDVASGPPGDEDRFGGFFDPDYQFAPQSIPEEAALRDWLIPETVEGVPFTTVCVLLGLCLLAVAPGDYLLLGWLRRRKWTWILFPAVAVGFTLLTMKIARSHIGQTESVTSLGFLDLTADGRIARSSTFELTFANTSKTRTESLEEQYVASFQNRAPASFPRSGVSILDQQLSQSYRDAQSVRYALEDQLNGDPLVYAGRVPRRFSVTRQLRQWSPQLLRRTAFAPGWASGDPAAGIPWSDATYERLDTEAEFREWSGRVRRHLPEAEVIVVSPHDILSTFALDDAASRDEPQPVPSAEIDPYTGEVVLVPDDAEWSSSRRVHQAALTALWASVRDKNGLFELVTQIAPTAAGNFEDLAVLDRADDSTLLLLVITSGEPGHYKVYRRLLRKEL